MPTLFAPLPNSSLIIFRIAFGLVLGSKYLSHLFDLSKPLSKWGAPGYHFTYPLFGWVQPIPEPLMPWVLSVMLTLCLCIAFGLFYRVAIFSFFCAFTYLFLIDGANYLNHDYLVILLSILMIFLPLARRWSLDVLFWPRLRETHAPGWILWLLRFQIAVPYFWGGVAKLNVDWLRAQPISLWIAKMEDYPLLGKWMAEPWMGWMFAYGGLIFDLSIVPLLLWRRSRPFAYGLALIFHLSNARMFSIGIFPWLMIAATTIFLDANWPERLWAYLRSCRWSGKVLYLAGALLGMVLTFIMARAWHPVVLATGTLGAVVTLWGFMGYPSPVPAPTAQRGLGHAMRLKRAQYGVIGVLVLWTSVQCLLPLRHFLYPSNVHWSEHGHRFAWHMMLRSKRGALRFEVRDKLGSSLMTINPNDLLTPRQVKFVTTRPHASHQFAHYIKERFKAEGHPNVQVFIKSSVSLNGREHTPILNPFLDFAAEPRTFNRPIGIMPLEKPLPTPSYFAQVGLSLNSKDDISE